MRNKKKKILFMGFADQDIFGAQDLNAREIALRLNPDKFEPYIFLRRDDPDQRIVTSPSVRLISLPQIRKIRGLYILKTMLFGNFDVIVTGKVDMLTVLYLCIKKLFGSGKRQIHTVENLRPAPSGVVFDKMAKFIALNSDVTFAISKKISENSMAWCGKNLKLMYAVGIDQTVFYSCNSNTSHKSYKQIVGCGSLSRRKRPDVFLDIACAYPEDKFVWIGSGELEQELKEKIKKQNINNIQLLGSMSQNKIAEEFRKSDIFFLPSLHEGFPKVVIEAMACGLPAIVFDAYGPEAVIDGKTGFVVHTIQEAHQRIKELLDKDMKMTGMSNAAYERAKEFTWEIICHNYENVLENVAK